MMTRFFSVMLLSGGAICAQVAPAPQGAIYKVGGSVSAPRLVTKVAPEYSEEARRLSVNSPVTVSLVVTADGSPRDLKVPRRVGFGLDEKAMESVAQWRFEPGMKAGNPVAVYATIEVNFNLVDVDAQGNRVREVGVPTGRIEYVPSGAVPVAISGRFAKYQPPTPISLHLTFDVSEKGEVERLSCAEAAPPSILEAIRKIHFQPATAAGRPIRATAKLELSY